MWGAFDGDLLFGLNSSPYGLPFYLHIGLYPTEQEKTIDGICFTPMAYDLG